MTAATAQFMVLEGVVSGIFAVRSVFEPGACKGLPVYACHNVILADASLVCLWPDKRGRWLPMGIFWDERPFRNAPVEKPRKRGNRGTNLISARCEKQQSKNDVLSNRRFLLHGTQRVGLSSTRFIDAPIRMQHSTWLGKPIMLYSLTPRHSGVTRSDRNRSSNRSYCLGSTIRNPGKRPSGPETAM